MTYGYAVFWGAQRAKEINPDIPLSRQGVSLPLARSYWENWTKLLHAQVRWNISSSKLLFPHPHFSYDLSVLEVWNILCVPFLWSNIRCFLPCWLTLSCDNITSFYFRGVWFHIFTLFQVIRVSRTMFMVRAVEMADSCSRNRLSHYTCTINRVDFVLLRCL